jgi:hypothetical protein
MTISSNRESVVIDTYYLIVCTVQKKIHVYAHTQNNIPESLISSSLLISMSSDPLLLMVLFTYHLEYGSGRLVKGGGTAD